MHFATAHFVNDCTPHAVGILRSGRGRPGGARSLPERDGIRCKAGRHDGLGSGFEKAVPFANRFNAFVMNYTSDHRHAMTRLRANTRRQSIPFGAGTRPAIAARRQPVRAANPGCGAGHGVVSGEAAGAVAAGLRREKAAAAPGAGPGVRVGREARVGCGRRPATRRRRPSGPAQVLRRTAQGGAPTARPASATGAATRPACAGRVVPAREATAATGCIGILTLALRDGRIGHRTTRGRRGPHGCGGCLRPLRRLEEPVPLWRASQPLLRDRSATATQHVSADSKDRTAAPKPRGPGDRPRKETSVTGTCHGRRQRAATAAAARCRGNVQQASNAAFSQATSPASIATTSKRHGGGAGSRIRKCCAA